jgi:hypothetical protein
MAMLYNLTFGEITLKPYWTKKHDEIAPNLFTKSNWAICGQAMKQIPFGKKRWLVKQLKGFCAVGCMMKIWQAWSHALCPIYAFVLMKPQTTLFCARIHGPIYSGSNQLINLVLHLLKSEPTPRLQT